MINRKRKGLPKNFVTKQSSKRIDTVSNGLNILTKFRDKKQILCVSTIYNSDPVSVENDIKKTKKIVPNCIFKYSKNMRGVDLMDQQIQLYRFPHKSKKWWKRISFHILEIAVYNSYIV